MRILFVFFSLLSGLQAVFAQDPVKVLAFNALTINDGLSQGMVTRILQDRYGFMWFASFDGLNRYDGYRFTVYRHDAGDSSSISSSFAQSLFEDSRGRLWVGTNSGGLDLFDRETESFFHFKQENGTANSISAGPVESITEDGDGNIWLHIGDKLDKITVSKRMKAPREDFSICHIKVPFNSPTSFFAITSTNKIYYADATKGIIYRLKDEKKGIWAIELNLNKYVEPRKRDVLPAYRIVKLMEDKLRGKFYIFHEGGVTRIDENTGRPETTFRSEHFRQRGAPLQATLDKQGYVWFPGIGNLSFFDTRSGKVTQVTANNSDHLRALNHTYSTFVDRSGLLWIGTSGYGLLKRNIRSETFHPTGATSEYMIKEISNRKLIIGNTTYVRKIFDRVSGRLEEVSGEGKVNTPSRAYDEYIFAPVAADTRGEWFADSDRLRYYDKVLHKNSYFPLPVTSNHEYPELIQAKLRDPGGNLWLGTTEGLIRFRPADKNWLVFKDKANRIKSPGSNVIFSLCLDPIQPRKYLWIGTNSTGLERLDMVTGEFTSYSTQDGLPNNVIYGILPDDQGNLWMSTNKGLSCFNPVNKSFRNFDYKDGLQSNEFNRGAYCRTKDGCLIFGGVNGFNYFYPAEILNNATVPQVVITGLKVRNIPVSVRSKDSLLSTAIYLTDKLILSFEQNFVSFEFAALDFTNSEKNSYKYMLEGIDKEWINSNNSRSVTYTNLSPGSYTFKVKGSNNDGTWNEKATFIEMQILPPWYMTWWFRILITLLLLSAASTFYRYRLAQALKVQSIRDKIGKDLHDEVGSNLSNIFIFSNIAQQKAKIVDETGPLLQKITDYTQQSMEAMDDIVWMINTRNDRFENIMIRMRALAAEFSETCNCSLHLDFDEKLNNVKLNMEARKNMYLIYKEALTNIAKYAACKTLWIKLRLSQNVIDLEIKDNGKGFNLNDTGDGNGLINMKKRAQALKGKLSITSTPGGGTSLHLSFKV